MLDHNLLQKALKVAIEKGADYADIFVEDAFHNWVTSDDKKIDTDLTFEKGVGIRVVKDFRTYYAFTSSFEDSEIFKLAQMVRDASGTGGDKDITVELTPRERRWQYPFATDPADAALDRKIAMVKSAEDKAWSAPHTTQATVRFRDHQRKIQLASTLNESIVEHTLGLTEFAVAVFVAKDGIRESGKFGCSLYGGIEALSGTYAPEAMAAEAVRRAGVMLTAKDCPRGQMPVVFDAGQNGILFHESCGHGMEADLVESGSVFGGKMDQRVASEIVTIVDDGTLPGYPGSFEFDDEGTPVQKTTLIDKGILRNYMHSSITARKFETSETGSARRESFHYPPIPRMRNTYILAGKTPAEDIIKDTRRGLYAVDTGGGGQVNVITGEFITSIKLGYMIEDGKITYPVRGASIIGRGIDALQNIDMVGNDLEIVKMSGRCGKMQSVPVGVGMPTVRVKSLTVGGTGDAYEGGGNE